MAPCVQRKHMLAFGFTEQSQNYFQLTAEIGNTLLSAASLAFFSYTMWTSTHETNLDVKGANTCLASLYLGHDQHGTQTPDASLQKKSETAVLTISDRIVGEIVCLGKVEAAGASNLTDQRMCLSDPPPDRQNCHTRIPRLVTRLHPTVRITYAESSSTEHHKNLSSELQPMLLIFILSPKLIVTHPCLGARTQHQQRRGPRIDKKLTCKTGYTDLTSFASARQYSCTVPGSSWICIITTSFILLVALGSSGGDTTCLFLFRLCHDVGEYKNKTTIEKYRVILLCNKNKKKAQERQRERGSRVTTKTKSKIQKGRQIERTGYRKKE